MNSFYVIFMLNKNGKKMYLKCSNGNSMKWDFSKNEACWYNTETEAVDFAKNYFKNFTKWSIEEFQYNI